MAESQFPPDGYVPTRSTVEGITVYMPVPPIDDYDAQVAFACPNCGGEQAYSVRDGGLSCTTCGYYQPPQGERVGRGAEANEFRTAQSQREKAERLQQSLGAAALTTTADDRVVAGSNEYDWGEDRQELECNNCGATMLLAPQALTHVCPFCGSSSVVQHQFAQDKLRPRFLIPFKIVDETALTTIQAWLSSSWMTPRDLQQRAGLDELMGTYLPYWTFTARCTADWKAQVGHTKTEWYTDSQGNRRTRTKTVWRWESGHVNEMIRDLLVAGTAKLEQRLLDEVDQFQLQSLVEYDPSFLAGFNAQTYDVGRDAAWRRGREIMREMTKRACYGQASTSKIRNFSMSLDYGEEAWRYVLLPVYLTTYRYEDETYSVMVNGQTGAITGQRPVAWRKVALVGGVAMIPGVLVALSALLFFEGEAAQNALIVGGVVFLIGLVITGLLFWQATNIRKADA